MHNKGVSGQHDAADAAHGHDYKKGDDAHFGYAHNLLLMLIKRLYGEADVLMNH